MVALSDAWLAGPAYQVDALGFIPNYVSNLDPRPLKEQIAEKYAFGGGWHPMDGWIMHPPKDNESHPVIEYPASEEGETPEKYTCVAYFYHIPCSLCFNLHGAPLWMDRLGTSLK